MADRQGREPFTAEKEVARAADAVIYQARYAAAWRTTESLDILGERLADYDAAKAKMGGEG